MATLRINVSLRIEGAAIENDGINLPERNLTVSGVCNRTTVTVPAGESTTLTAGEITPRFWLFINPSSNEKNIQLEWGPGGLALLRPGDSALLPTDQEPTATGLETNGDPSSTDLSLTYIVVAT